MEEHVEAFVPRIPIENEISFGLGGVESRIVGRFRGWQGGTRFELLNGQVWQQTDFSCLYRFNYSPRVRILSTDEGYQMLVEGTGSAVPVRRIR